MLLFDARKSLGKIVLSLSDIGYTECRKENLSSQNLPNTNTNYSVNCTYKHLANEGV